MSIHNAIVSGLGGDSFGNGSETARDVISSLDSAGYRIVSKPRECEFWVVWDFDHGPQVQAIYAEEIDALRFAVNQGYGLKVTGCSAGEIGVQLDGTPKSGGAA